MDTLKTINRRAEERYQKRVRNDRKLLVVVSVLLLMLVAFTTKSLAFSNEENVQVGNFIDVQEEKAPESSNPSTKKVQKKKHTVKTQEESFYSEDIPMSYSEQKYLYALTTKYQLNYKKTLAVIQHESAFDRNATNATHDYGLFQINQVNHETLSKELNTANQPFDPYVNMEWGTYMLSELYTYWSEKGYSGQTLDEVVWSSYNKGKTGFMKYGHATDYIYKMKASIEQINTMF